MSASWRRGAARARSGCAAWLVGVSLAAVAAGGVALQAPAEVAGTLPAARLIGQGTLRYFGLAIYDARLWADADFAPGRYDAHTFALELHYARSLGGAAIAQRSIAEMRRVGAFDEVQAKVWLDQLTQALPDVKAGDRLTGVRGPGGVTRFYSNGQPTLSIADPEFGRLFFGIWLSGNTSEPALRRELIGQAS